MCFFGRQIHGKDGERLSDVRQISLAYIGIPEHSIGMRLLSISCSHSPSKSHFFRAKCRQADRRNSGEELSVAKRSDVYKNRQFVIAEECSTSSRQGEDDGKPIRTNAVGVCRSASDQYVRKTSFIYLRGTFSL